MFFLKNSSVISTAIDIPNKIPPFQRWHFGAFQEEACVVILRPSFGLCNMYGTANRHAERTILPALFIRDTDYVMNMNRLLCFR